MQAKQSRSFGNAAISLPESRDETTHFAKAEIRAIAYEETAHFRVSRDFFARSCQVLGDHF